jgi:hypothetical protein
MPFGMGFKAMTSLNNKNVYTDKTSHSQINVDGIYTNVRGVKKKKKTKT